MKNIKILNKSILQIAQEVDVNFTEDDYFYYIIESRLNGNPFQSRALYRALSTGMQGQRVDFLAWVKDTYGEEFRDNLHKYLNGYRDDND